MNLWEIVGYKISENDFVANWIKFLGGKKIFNQVNRFVYKLKYPNKLELSFKSHELLFDTSSFSAKKWFYPDRTYQNHEGQVPNFLFSILDEDCIFYDVGSHMGLYTVLTALKAEEVHAFDMNAHNIQVLEQNVMLNGFENVKTNNVAVGENLGKLNFKMGEGSVSDMITEGSSTVETISLDSYAEHNRMPTVLKIDVEGAEMRVLRGMDRIIEKAKPQIICEIHERKMNLLDGNKPRNVVEYLRQKNYKVKILDQETSKLKSLDSNLKGNFTIFAEKQS